MSRSFVVAALVSGVVLAAGCAPIEPEGAAYGVMHRAGIASATYAPVISTTHDPLPFAFTGELGFEASGGVEVDYALPLGRGFDLRFAFGSNTLDAKFPDTWPAASEATWKMRSLMVLLTGGGRWGRLGLHFSAGPGWLFNDLEAPGLDTDADGSFAMQTDLGITVMVSQVVELGLEVGYRTSRATYKLGAAEYSQTLDGGLVKFGVHVLF